MSQPDPAPTLPPANVLWGRVATAVAVVLLAFSLGRCTAEGVPAEDVAALETEVGELQSTNEQLRSQVADLEAAVREAETAPTTSPTEGATEAPSEAAAPAGEGEPGGTWTIAPGDTLHAIAIEVYGDRQQAALIAAANGIDNSTTLTVGQVLQLPQAP